VGQGRGGRPRRVIGRQGRRSPQGGRRGTQEHPREVTVIRPVTTTLRGALHPPDRKLARIGPKHAQTTEASPCRTVHRGEHIARRIERPGNPPDSRGQNRAPISASANGALPAAPTASSANNNNRSVIGPPPGGAARGPSPRRNAPEQVSSSV